MSVERPTPEERRAVARERLKQARTAGDYEDFVSIDVAHARNWLPQAAAFVEEAAALIASERP